MGEAEVVDGGSAGHARRPPVGETFAAALRGFGFIGIAAFIAIVGGNLLIAPVGAILALLWAWAAGVPMRDIGFSRPRSWLVAIGGGIVFGVLLKLAMKAVVMPLLGAPAVNPAFHWMANNPDALPRIFISAILIAGFGEEIVFRGYMFERLKRLLGTSREAMIAIIGLSTIIFALPHAVLQGTAGAQNAAITGLIVAIMFARTGNLWMPIATHAAFDVTAFLIIYFDVEEAVARSVWA